jgi:hypothetical protein
MNIGETTWSMSSQAPHGSGNIPADEDDDDLDEGPEVLNLDQDLSYLHSFSSSYLVPLAQANLLLLRTLMWQPCVFLMGYIYRSESCCLRQNRYRCSLCYIANSVFVVFVVVAVFVLAAVFAVFFAVVEVDHMLIPFGI